MKHEEEEDEEEDEEEEERGRYDGARDRGGSYSRGAIKYK